MTLAAGLVALLLSTTPFGRDIEERVGEYVLFHLRGPLGAPPEVVLVALERGPAGGWDLAFGNQPWPRSLHASLVEKLSDRGAVVIALDIIFSTSDLDNDDRLAAVFRRAAPTVLLRGLERRIVGSDSSIEIDVPTEPIPMLADAASAVAPFPLPKVPARVSRFWTFHGMVAEPTLPSVVLQLANRDIAGRLVELLATEPSLLDLKTEDWTGPNVTTAMRRLHTVLRANPVMPERLKIRLRDTPWSEAEKKRLDALIALYAGEDSRHVNFYGPAGSIRTISYATLLSESQGRAGSVVDDLSGKVVFIGVSELRNVTQSDAYDTVYSGMTGVNLSGAEIAATAFANLAEMTSPRTPLVAVVLEICVVALILGGAASFGRVFALVGAGALTVGIVLMVGWYGFLTQNWLLPIANPIFFEIPIGVLAGMWCLRAEEHHRHRSITHAARQYLPEEVVRTLASGPLRGSEPAAGEVRYSVCLASDIEGFTSLSEKLPPKAVQQLLNEYFRRIFGVLQQHGGVVSDIAGDGVMCLWSAPAKTDSVRIGAVAAAVGILETVEEFNLANRDHMMPTRIGIHAGAALVGIVGGAGRYVSTVVGDVANTASRIEGLNKQLGTRLLASEEALEQVTGFVLRPLGEFPLAGKAEPIRVSEVLGRVGSVRAATLAEGFANAFGAYEARDWEEAILILGELLRVYPQDGPSRYLLAQATSKSRSGKLRFTLNRLSGSGVAA